MSKVAVIVPVYNVEKYLEECLNSLVGQTLKDILIIAVNDGSTDNSLQILNNFAKQDNRFIIVNKANSGYGDTMNVGIDIAINRGAEYIAFMDPDDYISLDGYEKLYKLAKENDIDILRANITSFLENDDGVRSYFYNDSLKFCPQLYDKLLQIKYNKEIFTMNSNCGGLFNAKFIKENFIKHNTTAGAAYQDIGFWFQSYALSKNFYFTANRYYFYRRERDGSSEGGKKDKDIIFKEYAYIKNFLNKNPSLKSEFLYQFHSAKYRSLYWYFHVLKAEHRKEFVYKISHEFKNAINDKEITLDEAKNISEYLFTIITDPDKFLKQKEQEEKEIKRTPFIIPK